MSTISNDIACRISRAITLLEMDAIREEINYAVLPPDQRGELEDLLAARFAQLSAEIERAQLPDQMKD